MEINGRKVLGKFLFGSSIYGLENEKSDKDYRVVIAPNWEELYLAARRQETMKIGDFAEIDGVDYSIFNIMGLSTQIAVGSPYWTEILYTTEAEVSDEFKDLWEFLIKNREDLVRMHLRGFWQNHLKAVGKHLKLYEKKGKQSLLHHALRHLCTLERFATYNDYGRAICYGESDKGLFDHQVLMRLKDNHLTAGELIRIHKIAKDKLSGIGQFYEFYDHDYTGEHHEYIKEQISNIVRKSVSI